MAISSEAAREFADRLRREAMIPQPKWSWGTLKCEEGNDMEDYKIRFIKEYRDLSERMKRLGRYINKITAVEDYGANDEAPHDCPRELLEEQYRTMSKYKNILEVRATIEKVDLTASIENE